MEDETFDLLVVGGGVTGCGVALDAASRGLRVALVEANDIASGTSSRSSKLVHGGVRYLEQLRFGLVREALRERRLLHEWLAPHLVSGVEFLYPLTHRVWERGYVGAGLALYDTLAGRSDLPRHRHLSRRRALAVAPGLDPELVTGAVTYHDGQVDDARLTLALARTAEEMGARITTRARVESLSSGVGAVRARVLDVSTQQRLELRATRVINAVGPWMATFQRDVGLPGPAVTTSKGVHLVVDREAIDATRGIITRTPSSVLFLIPWQGQWLVGTTDTPWSGAPAEVRASAEDIAYLLNQANRILARPLRHSEVRGTFAGLRPLVAQGGSQGTARLSREHVVVEQAEGVFAIIGGKLTTYRVMARDAVDAAFAGLGVPLSCTHELPLQGARDHQCLDQLRRRMVGAAPSLPGPTIERLIHRYGDDVRDMIGIHGDGVPLGAPLRSAPLHVMAEVVWAVRREQARSFEDVLVRRTRIALETPDQGRAAAQEMADVMARELGWSPEALGEALLEYDRVADTLGVPKTRDRLEFVDG